MNRQYPAGSSSPGPDKHLSVSGSGLVADTAMRMTVYALALEHNRETAMRYPHLSYIHPEEGRAKASRGRENSGPFEVPLSAWPSREMLLSVGTGYSLYT
ncbi:hypothetical protein NUU61_005687 [Penicillium alfredii]|uniref:Uncharacterized protein n=1 Tax=Penicillium alfredii TaxID=1506179 RepID=A0A9W9K8F7_9EURO|nr:uncharacterized protein NUU61_005687 [Penicillium alfredii]KAJ5096331.1 hypothetical protein NUU61_005687 [Penicillium alfredii]